MTDDNITALTNATEDLRKAFNGILERYQMNADTALALLARISAGYIHRMQRASDNAGMNDIIEERFQELLTVFLTDLDMTAVAQEVEKIKNQNLN